MEGCCDLEVDVNGDEKFMVDMKILSSYSGRLRKLFSKSAGTRNFKVIFQDFPGEAEGFELMTRFCYNNGRPEVMPSNIAILYCVAHFMEMSNSVSGAHNLLELTEKSLDEINYWTWSELLVALKQCQNLLVAANCSVVVQRCLDSLIGRLALTTETSPCPSTSSPDSSGFRLSCDSRSTESLKNSSSRAFWWFDDLAALNLNILGMVIKSMVSRKFDHAIISKYLFYYQKSNFVTAPSDEKCMIIERVIDMLHSLDQSSVSFKSLFGILRVSLNLKIKKCCRNKLEDMIGSQMDLATLDNLLVPSSCNVNYLYDVNLVLRFLKVFLSRGICKVFAVRLRKVASLMDLYIAEVAPDPCLKPSKFLALAMALPDSARDSYDEIYSAIDMYLEVHAGLSEEEMKKICCALNYEKLSSDTCIHLSQNRKFPSNIAAQALFTQQRKLRALLQDTNHPQSFTDSPCSFTEIECKGKTDEASEQIVLYAGKVNLCDDNEKLRAHLQGMQQRVMELEKLCRQMQTQMRKIMKSKSSHSSIRSLPKLCS